MALKFEITGDNSNLLSSLDGARDGVRRTAHDIEQSGIGIEDMFNRIANGVDGLSSKLNSLAGLVGVGFGLDQLKGFVQKMSETRAYFQDIESSMEVFLGNQRKAAEFTEQLKDYAYYNMFEFSDLADASKQMIAYGNSVDTIIPRLDQLSNIATGTNADLMELVNLYNRAKSLGEVGSQSLASWATKGLVVKDVLKEMGIEVEGTSVSFEQLNMVLDHVTAEGGMFHDLMLNQMSNISAEQGQMEDNLTAMYNEIGEKYQDVITKWYKMNSEIAENFVDTAGGILDAGAEVSEFLLDHYSEIGKAIGLLIVTYGEYKASLIATRAIERTMANQANGIEQTRQSELQNLYGKYSDNSDIMAIGQETAAEEANTAAIIQNTASREGNVTAIDEQIAALERKMLSELDEYDAIIETAQAAVDAASAKEAAADSEIASLTEQSQEAKEYIDVCVEQYQAALSFGDAEDIETAKRELNTAATEAENAEKALATAQSNKESAAEAKLAAQKNLETAASRKQATQEKLTNFQKAVGTVQTKAQTTATGLWVAMTNAATKAMNGLKAAMMSNPFGVALAAITTIISLLPIFSDETSKASAEVERFGENAVKQTRNLETLMMVVDSTSEDSKVHKDAVDELCDIYEEYGFKIDDEIDKLQQLKDMHDLVTDAIHKEGEERQKANLLASYNDALEEATTKMRDALQDAFENAEWDGSGTFDDWDADEYQERAEELTQIIGAIIQSEGDNLATLTGDELEQKIAEVNDRIEKAYQDMGLQLSKAFIKSGGTMGAQGYTIDAPVDVDAIQIMRDYADAIGSVTKGRNALLETFEKEKKAHPEVQKEVDYTTMSISDLAKEASKASDGLSDLGDQSVSPSVDKSSIDDATDAAGSAKTGIDLLNGATAKPIIDTTSIGLAIGQTNTLLGNMFQLQNFGMGGGQSNFSLGFNPNKFGFGQTGQFSLFGGKKPVWGTIGGKPGVQWIPDIPITDPALLAQQELNNRVNGANSQKKVDDLLKEVNEAFNKATFDSDEYKFLEGLKKRLEAKSRKKSGKTGKKSDTASKIEKEQQKLEDLQDDLDLKRLRSIQDMQTRITDTRLDLMADGAEKVRLLQEQQNKEEIAALERQREDAIREYIEGERRLFEQQERIKKAKNSNYKEKQFDESTVDTSAIAAQYDELINLTREKQLQAEREAESDALNNYLKEYGDYQQQKLAITEIYAEKIKNATTFGERLSLERELDEALSKIDMSQFKESINWEVVFNDLDRVSLEHLQALKKQLKDLLDDDNITAENAKVISERISEINDNIASRQKEWQSAFGFVIPELEKMRRLKQEEVEAQERLNKAQERQAAALKEVEEIRKRILELAKSEGVEVDEKEVNTQGANGIMDMFKSAGKDTSELGNLFSQLAKKETSAAQSTEALALAEAEAGAAAEAAGGSFASTVAIIDKIIHAVNDNIQSANDLFAQMGLSDTKFGKGFGSFAESSQYATQAWESLKSGNVMGVANGVYGSLRTLGDALGEWGIGGFGSSDTSLLEDIERLTASNEALKYSIDELADKMSEGAVADAEAIYKQQKEQLAQSEKNTQEMMSRSAAAYSNGFLGIGGSHSSNKKINDGVKSSEWNRISQLLGKSVTSAGQFFNLTSEEMYKVAVELPDVYAHIKDLANDGYKDAAQFMDQYLEYAKQREELEKAYLQKLTSVSFDSLQDDFASVLMDMDADAEDFAESFEKYMQQAIINSLVSEQYKPLLEKWYKAFGAYMKDGTISEDEMKKLRESGGTYYDETTGKYESFQSWQSMSDSALAARDALKDVFGWADSGYKQEASSKGFQSMSQDTGEELNGRFTALQIAGESMAAQAISIYSQMMVMSQVQVSSNTYLSEIRNMMITGNSYLEDIAKYSKKIYLDFTTKLEDLIDNTKNL